MCSYSLKLCISLRFDTTFPFPASRVISARPGVLLAHRRAGVRADGGRGEDDRPHRGVQPAGHQSGVAHTGGQSGAREDALILLTNTYYTEGQITT